MHKVFSSFLLCIFVFLACQAEAERPVKSLSNLIPSGPIYHIPLRIHLGNSKRAPKDWLPILEEINFIWLKQAGICFAMDAVLHDDEIENGLDLWFETSIPEWNGYFSGPHDIHVRDDPNLRPAQNPAKSSAARTAAHELGHALGLGHKQDSDDNLMRSKTYGWQLHKNEILQARRTADQMDISSRRDNPCPPPAINTTGIQQLTE